MKHKFLNGSTTPPATLFIYEKHVFHGSVLVQDDRLKQVIYEHHGQKKHQSERLWIQVSFSRAVLCTLEQTRKGCHIGCIVPSSEWIMGPMGTPENTPTLQSSPIPIQLKDTKGFHGPFG